MCSTVAHALASTFAVPMCAATVTKRNRDEPCMGVIRFYRGLWKENGAYVVLAAASSGSVLGIMLSPADGGALPFISGWLGAAAGAGSVLLLTAIILNLQRRPPLALGLIASALLTMALVAQHWPRL